MADLCVWTFAADGKATSVPPEHVGRFKSGEAYVVQAPPEGDSPQPRLYLWAGDEATKELKSSAAKHAAELVRTLDASYLRQQQGQESLEFKQLFDSFEVVVNTPAAAAEEAAPAAAEHAAEHEEGEEEEEEGEHEEGEHEEEGEHGEAVGAGGAAAAGGKKKKRNKKKKKHSQQQEVGNGAGTAPAASPAKLSLSPRGRPQTPTSPTPMSPEHSKLHAEAKPFCPSSFSPPPSRPASATPAAAAPAASPKQPSPAAAAAASPKQPSPAAAAASPKQPSPAPASAAKASPAPAKASPAPASPAPASAAKASPAKASPAPASAAKASPAPASAAKRPSPVPTAAPASSPPAAAKASPAHSASPKGEVEESSSPGVAKAKEQLMKRLSGSLELEKQQQKEKGAGGRASGTYLADSAKAWGGVSGAAAAAHAPVEVKIKPGEQTFDYETLKGLRVESGIDMAHKEAYLDEVEFTKVFGKDPAAWKAQPAWRQQLSKKEVGLW